MRNFIRLFSTNPIAVGLIALTGVTLGIVGFSIDRMDARDSKQLELETRSLLLAATRDARSLSSENEQELTRVVARVDSVEQATNDHPQTAIHIECRRELLALRDSALLIRHRNNVASVLNEHVAAELAEISELTPSLLALVQESGPTVSEALSVVVDGHIDQVERYGKVLEGINEDLRVIGRDTDLFEADLQGVLERCG